MSRALSAVAHEVNGRLIGADTGFGVVATDTRALAPGALFVAISGERFDGNDFIVEAHSKGAAGALVSRPAAIALPQIQVTDTRRAFGAMARAWRANFGIPVVAITGSAGKTTVKELVASIVGVRHSVCVTQGNLNNEIGVPLTLMRLDESDEALVVELGANHAGEIDMLAALVQPTVGVITNAYAAHLEGFGSLAGVAAAKGELLEHLPRAGTAVLNADDPYFADWRARTPTEYVITFGATAEADCQLLGEPVFGTQATRFSMRLPTGDSLEVDLPLLGMANVTNALAATAAAHAVGVSVEEIRTGLESIAPIRGRLTALPGIDGSTIIDDSYNANPSAARAALDFLAKQLGRRVFVLGDMGELGVEGEELHQEVGRYAISRCDDFFAVGSLAAAAAEAYGKRARSFTDNAVLAAELVSLLGPDVTVLIKGSRAMGLEQLVTKLVDVDNGDSAPC